MKVFLGWSGERSKAMALALRDWLPLVLHYVEPWMSETDISAGQRWPLELGTELEGSNFGILSITPDNMTQPWILFEAGSLAKSFDDGRVIPFLLDLDNSDIAGPLAQFQSKKATKEGTRGIVDSINGCSQAKVESERVLQLFDSLWPIFEQKLNAIPPTPTALIKRDQHEILEELVTNIRAFDSRLTRMEDSAGGRGSAADRRPRRTINASVIEAMSNGQNDPIVIVLFACQLRDEFPPLYELAMEAYRAASRSRFAQAIVAIERYTRMAHAILLYDLEDPFSQNSESKPIEDLQYVLSMYLEHCRMMVVFKPAVGPNFSE